MAQYLVIMSACMRNVLLGSFEIDPASWKYYFENCSSRVKLYRKYLPLKVKEEAVTSTSDMAANAPRYLQQPFHFDLSESLRSNETFCCSSFRNEFNWFHYGNQKFHIVSRKKLFWSALYTCLDSSCQAKYKFATREVNDLFNFFILLKLKVF